MTNRGFKSLLARLGACSDSVEWVGEKDLHEVWIGCERGDWLLWITGHMAGEQGWPTRQQVVLAACACAETALKFVPAGEDRPRLAIETARAWANGTASIEDVRCARVAAADAAAAAYAAAYAAADAAADAAAAYDAASAAYAAYAAAAAYAASDAASAPIRRSARATALAECAAIVRRGLPEPLQSDGGAHDL